jgi:DNA-binding transcriptional LysR family regulator
MHSDLNWDDLRIVLAVARQGSLSAAARSLGITHSTVYRRLGAIEHKMGARLFERFRDGYAPTPAGENAASVAERFAEEVLQLERRFAGEDLRPSGIVRITTTDTIATLLARHLSALRAAHPEIKLEVAVSNAIANLTRRDADIAIRPTPRPTDTLMGRRIAEIAHAIYGSRECLSRSSAKRLSAHEWIGLDESLAGTAIGRWLAENISEAQVACWVDALPALRDAAVAGMGLALLPCYVGDITPGLTRAFQKQLPELRSGLWLLTHHDLRRAARIRAVIDFLATSLASDRPLIEGKRKTAGSATERRSSRY